MRIKEILGKEVKDLLNHMDYARMDDVDLGNWITRIARDVVQREGRSRDALIPIMYGNPVDEYGDDLDEVEQRARIDQIRAKTAKDLVAAASTQQQAGD